MHWKRFAHDTHKCINLDKPDYIMKKLNSYHKQIQFYFRTRAKLNVFCF